MPWEKLGIFFIKPGWTLTKPVEAELFRIKHLKIYQADKYYLKAAIAQAFKVGFDLTTFNTRRFSYRTEPETFEFYFPPGLGEHSLAFKRLDDSPVSWRIEAEYFYSENPLEDYQNYINNRFGQPALNQFNQDMSALYPRLFSGSTTPNSGGVSLKAGEPKKVLNENLGRTEFNIRSKGHPVILATGFDEAGKPLVVLEEMPPNYSYNHSATTAGLYKGEVWAIAEQDTSVSFTEYIAQ
ncbi:hypothetical protein Riv7116_1853 [Rivularia sp. PCC 7116]|uniref:hypothetical protein n=1 Tax=Rivularia sp. PCC 7116 TaxID=373994 RepID=UPI00029F3CB8|nr:hypothetical protein [Rivularia sp. PCC 7116]AFY54394.1 hypothetical protein Riv7116_1853 [Rivularia sp. PCC 7116]